MTMKTTLKLPVGIENFEEIRNEGFYYVDKTALIRELLEDGGKVTLFTRPRRFGKSLNMNMLKYFFEYGCDGSLFEELEIAGEKALCEAHMGKYPVISVTLKDINARDYTAAKTMLKNVIGNEALRFGFLEASDRLSEGEREQYRKMVAIGGEGQPMLPMPDDVLEGSLKLLSKLLRKHYGQKVVLLIDEYDVPLDKARQSGYYEEMVMTIRNLLSQTLKSSDDLFLAVMTGCLRIAWSFCERPQESIFTGLNNLKVMSITNVQFGEYCGFSDAEVRAMLHHYGADGKYEQVRTWYDGYTFGKTEVYCPWDVINYCDELRADPDAAPRAFWVNSSGNDIIRTFLRKATQRTRREIEQLVDGECIPKKVIQELTYRELYENIDNVWSVLFTTGYLTQRGKTEDGAYLLAIPNLEIRQIFVEQILEWFQEEARRETPKLDAFCESFLLGDAEAVEAQFNAYLKKAISVRNTAVRKDRKEHFYHGVLLGLLSHREDWDVFSNAESGAGYSDILVETEEGSTGIVIEVKYSEAGDEDSLEAGCRKALEQIEEMGYEERLRQDGAENIVKYGIACNRKKCRVRTVIDKLDNS